jgi:hypothetical protein
MAGFTVATFYYNKKYDFFESKFTKIFRLIQEVSMTLLVTLINVFYYNNNFNILTNDVKIFLVMFFILLLSINILLEIANAVVIIIDMVKTKRLAKKRLDSKVNDIIEPAKIFAGPKVRAKIHKNSKKKNKHKKGDRKRRYSKRKVD